MKKQKASGKLLRFLPVIIWAVLGAALGIALCVWADSLFPEGSIGTALVLLILLLALVLSLFLHIILHEGGHLIAGLLSGYRFCSFRIGSVEWTKTENGIHLHRLSLAGTGGQCLMAPPELQNGTYPTLLYNVGGVLMNMFLGLCAIVPALLIPLTPLWKAVLIIFGAVGLLTGLTNGIPLHTALVDNDGYNALEMHRSPDAAMGFWLQLKINEQLTLGRRLKDLPEEWFHVPGGEAGLKNSMTAAIAVFETNRLMDAHRFAEAEQRIRELLNHPDSAVLGVHRSLMSCDLLYLELIGQNRSEVLDRMRTPELNVFLKQMRKFLSCQRVEYAWALLRERNSGKAEEIHSDLARIAAFWPYAGDAQSELELAEIAVRRAREIPMT